LTLVDNRLISADDRKKKSRNGHHSVKDQLEVASACFLPLLLFSGFSFCLQSAIKQERFVQSLRYLGMALIFLVPIHACRLLIGYLDDLSCGRLWGAPGLPARGDFSFAFALAQLSGIGDGRQGRRALPGTSAMAWAGRIARD
jgi:hypothetical protein